MDLPPRIYCESGDDTTPFRWDEAKPETIKEFRTCLADLEVMLPLNEPSQMSSRELAWRCFVASGGLMSYLMTLVRRATNLALSTGRESLDLNLLATVFDQRLAGQRRGLANPFVGDLPQINLKTGRPYQARNS